MTVPRRRAAGAGPRRRPRRSASCRADAPAPRFARTHVPFSRSAPSSSSPPRLLAERCGSASSRVHRVSPAVSEDGTQLDVDSPPGARGPNRPGDLHAGSSVGVLAIDFAARRRYRVNGTVRSIGAGISLDVREAFGNCPKYIHAYTPLPDGPRVAGLPASPEPTRRTASAGGLSEAETLFLGTTHPDAGADVVTPRRRSGLRPRDRPAPARLGRLLREQALPVARQYRRSSTRGAALRRPRDRLDAPAHRRPRDRLVAGSRRRDPRSRACPALLHRADCRAHERDPPPLGAAASASPFNPPAR